MGDSQTFYLVGQAEISKGVWLDWKPVIVLKSNQEALDTCTDDFHFVVPINFSTESFEMLMNMELIRIKAYFPKKEEKELLELEKSFNEMFSDEAAQYMSDNTSPPDEWYNEEDTAL